MAKKTAKKEEVVEEPVVEEPVVEKLPVEEVAKVHPKILAKEEEEKYLAKHAENLKTKKVFVHESGQLGYIDDDNNFVPK